ncbi:MAG: type III pantothenate kinase [Thermodesulfobacteriota bacterium]
MLLVIDIGNTNTVIGLFKGEELICDWRIRTEREVTADELGVVISHLFAGAGQRMDAVDKTVIASVVPPVDRAYASFCGKYLTTAPRWIDASTATGITICYHNPSEIGADRIVNAVAAYHKYKCDLIVIDFGTAITFDLISAAGVYTGGIIAPGIAIAADALFQRASKLPRVDLLTPPESLIGRNTEGSIKSGIIYGFAGLVDGVVKRIKTQENKNWKVIATGGLSALIADISETIESVEPNLTLEGLRIIGTSA